MTALFLALCLQPALARDAAGVPQALPVQTLLVGSTPVVAEIADDPAERNTGLMYRTEISPGTGMLFVYPDNQPRSFWMKNTGVPLSIAFIDPGGEVINIEDMVPFELSPVHSAGAATYALEVPRGWFASNGIGRGAAVVGLPAPSAR